MAKTKDKHKRDNAENQAPPPGTGPLPKLKRKPYEREMRVLHGELVAMQEWVKETGAKICIVFEGRDTAGKGGTIKRITERVSPRVFRVVALAAPTEREKSQMYIQRYIEQFPAGGEVVIFDRSWYNRAGVERVMGFCTPEETDRFLELVPGVEKAMADNGILLLKYWLEVSADEQTRRLESRVARPAEDLEAVGHGPEVLQPLVRLLPGPGRDVRRHRHRMGALVRRVHRRQEARPAQHHQPPAEPGPVQAAPRPGHQAAQAAAGRRLRGAGPAVAVHPNTVLDRQERPGGENDKLRTGCPQAAASRDPGGQQEAGAAWTPESHAHDRAGRGGPYAAKPPLL